MTDAKEAEIHARAVVLVVSLELFEEARQLTRDANTGSPARIAATLERIERHYQRAMDAVKRLALTP